MTAESEETLEEMLVELKDTSELMIDLAYSALLIQSKDLARQLLELEEYFDGLHMRFELAVIGRKGNNVDERGVLGLIRLGFAAETISDAAAEIAKIVLLEIPTHPILQMAVTEAEDIVEMSYVREGSILDGRTLQELALEDKIGMKIIAVRRGLKWTYNPRESTVIHAGDLLVASGYAEGGELFKRLASGELREI
ncbi:MAG: TrkA C-terminal domain-containing protein [Candidatus Bathyarchaeia archaeon]